MELVKPMKELLLSNLDQIHTTDLGMERIRKNLNFDMNDVVEFCKKQIRKKDCHIYKQGKNWYCEVDHIKIVVNSHSYTIITAHRV